ncbi:MAG: preprotein translocase subunit SecA [Clostridia bacterium]|nr:preprotein translocase subunit SecA [Clostridia bacterium]
MGFLNKIFKSYSEKEVKRVMPIVEKINSLEPEMEKLSDEELRAKTDYFKSELANGKTLNDILPEAFAVMREASKRVLGMRHFDVQLIGGIILHQGRIAEMRTGEGKTLVATLPVYLNALEGKGVHVITVNEYLAKRDSDWMGKVYRFLGLSVGLVLGRMDNSKKQEAYRADITYGTNNEFGFDYLRDNMVINKEDMVQRELNYAIVDEIDSILIDEARTPLIISGRANKSSDLYKKADSFVRKLNAKIIVEEDVKDEAQSEDNENYDYIVDLKAKSAALTGKGIEKAEQYFNLDNFNDLENSDLVHNVNQALRAHGIMKRDIDYIVKDGEVLIVDEFTGRIMYGRRYNDGLHQAIEAKEGVKIADESKTLATITFQNYFRMYSKLSGMTGTAMTEEAEFREIYNLDVIAIPTNKPLIRDDETDVIYKNEKGKLKAIVENIKECHEKGQPVLVGTVSIEKSELVSEMLKKEGLKHEVLNAKNHEKEAEIIAQAGKFGAITIATNMAGRGTDIMLGGNSEYLAKQEMRKLKYDEELIVQATAFNETKDEKILEARNKFKELQDKFEKEIEEEKNKVIEAGGLRIIGTERHESRRIDNQLRGRSGRQGDPGSTQFYLGLDDNLIKIFGGDMITKVFEKGNIPEDMPIQVGLIGKTIESAQSKVEGRNFSIRKHILSYDDVMNVQRDIIYTQRRKVLDGDDLRENIIDMLMSSCEMIVDTYASDMEDENFNKNALINEIRVNLNMTPETINDLEALKENKINSSKLITELQEKVVTAYEEKEKVIGPEIRNLERIVLLKIVDSKWMEHIDAMDELKNGIGLRAYGQKDPVVQYRIEGADMFDEMIAGIKLEVTKIMLHLFKTEVKMEQSANITSASLDNSAIQSINDMGESNVQKNTSDSKPQPIVNDGPKVGRNDPCPCGSGKKYKNCCGKNA